MVWNPGGSSWTARRRQSTWSVRAQLEERREAFQQLLDQELPALLGFAKRMMGQEADAHDLLQDALLQAYQALPWFRAESGLKHWVLRILIHEGIKKARRRRLFSTVASWFKGGAGRAAALFGLSPADTPEQQAGDRQQGGVAAGGLGIWLSARQRAVIVLRYLEGMSVEEIARAMGTCNGMVKTHLVWGSAGAEVPSAGGPGRESGGAAWNPVTASSGEWWRREAGQFGAKAPGRVCTSRQSVLAESSRLGHEGALVRAATQPTDAELWQARESLQPRLRPASRVLRWALASVAMAGGLLVGSLVLGGRPDAGLEQRVSERLVTLLDDLAPLVGASTGEVAQVSEAQAQAAGLLDDGTGIVEDEDESWPDSYQLIGEALDNSWL